MYETEPTEPVHQSTLSSSTNDFNKSHSSLPGARDLTHQSPTPIQKASLQKVSYFCSSSWPLTTVCKLCWFQATNFDDDGGLFDDIATEVMQDHGIDLSDVKDRSFKDALILVHEAKTSTQKKLNEILFYLNQIPNNSGDRNPVSIIKVRTLSTKTLTSR